jgi:KDO2-lipid IV(A) lauroyltransferase
MPLNLVSLIGGWLGDLDYRISSPKRIARMSGNISSALGVTAQDARRIVRQNLKIHMLNNLELMKYPKVTKAKIDDLVTFEHLDRLDCALQKGKGVILMTAHFGAKQLLQIALGLHGYPTNQIHYHMRSDELTFIQKHVAQRQRMRIEAQIPINFISAKGFLRSAFKCLQDNQVLIMAGDGVGLKQYMDKSYHSFEIFNKLMLFPIGPVAMARRTGAALLPVFVVRKKIGHRIVFETPLRLVERQETEAIATYVKLLELYIRQYPWQWEFWEEFDETVLLTTARQGADP